MQAKIQTPTAVFCDFDGTITHADATDAILERFAVPAWRDWETQWDHGKISSQTCLFHQVELIRAEREELLAFAAALPIDEGIYILDQVCRARGIPLTILSDGLDGVVKAILKKHGLLHIPVFANHLQWNGDGTPTLTFPYAKRECLNGAGTCKCARTMGVLKSGGWNAYIGDGRSDFCVSTRVQTLFAKGELQRWCKLQNITYHPFKHLTEVAECLFPDAVVAS